ncbi:unnamed protein product, partial [Ectocarpus fasciculatus]
MLHFLKRRAKHDQQQRRLQLLHQLQQRRWRHQQQQRAAAGRTILSAENQAPQASPPGALGDAGPTHHRQRAEQRPQGAARVDVSPR